MTIYHNNYAAAATAILEQVGKKIVIGAPLGIGKPIGLLNALYRLAEQDSSINLTIITALTLARPDYGSVLEERLVAPILTRMLGDYEDPLYEKARVLQQLPPNITVIEFFLTTAKYLLNDYVQQNYINSTYSLAVRDSLHHGVNVFAQQVARSTTDPDSYSVSCNSDLFYSVVKALKKSATEDTPIAVVAEVNDNLPFMFGSEAVVKTDVFTNIVDTKNYRHLFAIPHDELSAADHLIGLYTSFMVKDDSCLQIGIGKLSNAVANALILRHKNNAVYQEVYRQLQAEEKFGLTITGTGTLVPFSKGLYASTEMLSDSYMQLYKENILKKRVYDHIGLQRLLNEKAITENVTPATLDILLENNLIHAQLTAADVEFLQKFGIFAATVQYQNGQLQIANGPKIPADLTDKTAKQQIISHCLGKTLINGKIMHAGFFLGTNELYQQLRDLPLAEREQIDMTSIARTNALHWSYELLALQRQDARFVNTAMMVTIGGIVISDGLQNMREVSGVGGQFDFINMAQNLENARSIINCRSVRHSATGVNSNIIWEYRNFTVPRFLRDIIVTEYGIADCRSKTDSEVIKSMLNIADSRFQQSLLAQAKKAGKLAADYEIPKVFQNNYPEVIQKIVHELQAKGLCEAYPFGTELTKDEQTLAHALGGLKNNSRLKVLGLAIRALFFVKSDAKFSSVLERMQLLKPRNLQEFIYKKLLKFIIYKQHQ